METNTVPSLKHPILFLSLPSLKVESDEENATETIQWSGDGEVADFCLDYNKEESSSSNEIIESDPIATIKTETEDLDEKESDLHFVRPLYVQCERGNIKEKQIESNNREFDDDIVEPNGIKTETNDVNEELNNGTADPFKPEFIKQEELHIKDEERIKDCRNPKSSKPGKQAKLFQCPECSYSSIRKADLKSHSIKHKNDDEIDWYRCQECPYKTCRKSDIRYHVQTHNNLMLKCSKCCYETLKPGSFKIHQLEHKSNTRWLHCPECPYKTHLQSSFQSHTLVHKSKAFKCPNCSYQARTKQQLAMHQLKHESMDKWSSCPLCTYKTYDKKALTRHCLERHCVHPNKSKRIEIFKCTECSYKSGLKRNLKKHQMIHNESSWLQCPDCTFKTPQKKSFLKHQVEHQGEDLEGWLRCLECSYKTLNKYDLQKHLITHKSEDEIQWYECLQCEFKTRNKYYLKLHQLRHKEEHEIEWFCCYECEYKTKYKPNLVIHIFRHRKRNERGYV